MIMVFFFGIYLLSCFDFFTRCIHNVLRKNQWVQCAFLWQGTTSANLEDDDVCPFFLRWWSRLWSSLLLLLLLLFWEHVTNTCTSIKHDYGKNVFEIIINNSSKGRIKLNSPEMLSPVTTLNFLKSIISLSFYVYQM